MSESPACARACAALRDGRRHDDASRAWTPTTCRSSSPTSWSTTVVDAEDYVEQKMDAMRAHATQISVGRAVLRAVEQPRARRWGIEYYRLVQGQRRPASVDADGLETDLFAGV